MTDQSKTPIDLAIADLQHFEGFREYVYDDATGKNLTPGDTLQGHPTIGYGLALDVGGITEAEASYLLANRVTILETFASRDLAEIWASLCPTRQRVVINMLYQVGITGFDEFRNFRAALYAKDYNRAASEILNSLAARQTPARWQWLAQTMANGEACPYG